MVILIAILAGIWIVLAIVTAIVTIRRDKTAPDPESFDIAVRTLGHAMIDPFVPAIERFNNRLERMLRILHWPGARRCPPLNTARPPRRSWMTPRCSTVASIYPGDDHEDHYRTTRMGPRSLDRAGWPTVDHHE
ncbi:MAG TPA: hypothetical protein VFQ54_11035 [Thermomicrobiales bacterium]|nr:hypothetical protein [Thermomicrobiales bacterium]